MWRCRNQLFLQKCVCTCPQERIFLLKEVVVLVWSLTSCLHPAEWLIQNWLKILRRAVLPRPYHALHFNNLVFHTNQFLNPAGNHLCGERLLIFRLIKGGGLESVHPVSYLLVLLWIHCSCGGQIFSVSQTKFWAWLLVRDGCLAVCITVFCSFQALF